MQLFDFPEQPEQRRQAQPTPGIFR
jgi:hypothetical protein